MGHVFVEVQCGSENIQTGMIGKNFDYLTQIIMNNRGLGILFHSFDGHLEDKASVAAEIKEATELGTRMNFIQYELNEGQCVRAVTYLKEYREKNVGRYYGLANRPLHGEGGGCSAFGASVAEVAGVMEMDVQEAWTKTINIPNEFAGPPLQEKGVNIFKLIFHGRKWANEKEPHQKLMFWDPDLMYHWVNDKISKTTVEKLYTVKEIGKSKGVIVNKSFLPAPSGPIWQQKLSEDGRRVKD